MATNPFATQKNSTEAKVNPLAAAAGNNAETDAPANADAPAPANAESKDTTKAETNAESKDTTKAETKAEAKDDTKDKAKTKTPAKAKTKAKTAAKETTESEDAGKFEALIDEIIAEATTRNVGEALELLEGTQNALNQAISRVDDVTDAYAAAAKALSEVGVTFTD